MQQDWWPRCAFVQDYFFGSQRKIAHQVAVYLARYYVGGAISELTPSTDVSELMSDSIRRFIDREDFTLARDEYLFANIDFSDHISFRELVDLVQETCSAS